MSSAGDFAPTGFVLIFGNAAHAFYANAFRWACIAILALATAAGIAGIDLYQFGVLFWAFITG